MVDTYREVAQVPVQYAAEQDFPKMAHPSRCGGEGASCVVIEHPSVVTYGMVESPDFLAEDGAGVVVLPRNYDCAVIGQNWICSPQPDPDPQAELDNQE